MIEVTKNQFLLLIKISNINLARTYYDTKLAKELGSRSNNKLFRCVMDILKDNKCVMELDRIGSTGLYMIDEKKIIELIGKTDIFMISHNDYILRKFGKSYRIWEY